jgi:Type I restriction-modification system methyltransferase subunit
MLERDVENLLEQDLIRNGWHVNVGDPKRNVWRQEPKTPDEKEKLVVNGHQKFPDYILYEDQSTRNPIAIIETKRPEHKTLEDAKQQGLLYAKRLSATFLFLYNANRYLTYYVPTGETLLLDGEELKDLISLDNLKKFVGLRLDLRTKASITSKSDLIDVFKTANNKLREAGVTVGIERFTEFSNLLFLKLVSELNEERHYNISKAYLWDAYRKMDGEPLLNYINNTVVDGLNAKFDANETEPLFTKLKIQNPIKLKEIVDKLDTLDLASIDADIKGDAFEYFIQQYNSTNNDLGEYFTPRHIVKFLNDIIKPRFGEKIYDPFSGTGGMLIVAFERIQTYLEQNGQLDEENLVALRSNTIYGGELTDTARIAKMNMILTGDGHSNIKQQDSFANPVKDRYDVVLSNIPFNLDVAADSAQFYKPYVKKGNGVAIMHIRDALKQASVNARAAIIVPESVLGDTALKELRKELVESGQLRGVVSLPSKVFMPYTEAKTSVLILGGKTNVQTDDIFIFKAKSDGYTLTSRRRPISGINDLDEFIALHEQMIDEGYDTHVDSEKIHYVPRKKILANTNHSLLLFKYRDALKPGHVRLSTILERVTTQNVDGNPTASITNSDFWGMPLGTEHWGDNFYSVTSSENYNYTVVNTGNISFNPARANVGSFGINESDNPVAVSSAYPVYMVSDITKYLPEYVYLQIRHNIDVIEDINDRSYGTVRQSLGKDDFLSLQIPDLPVVEQRKIVTRAKDAFAEYEILKSELENFDLSL